jgi:hypothetical protein
MSTKRTEQTMLTLIATAAENDRDGFNRALSAVEVSDLAGVVLQLAVLAGRAPLPDTVRNSRQAPAAAGRVARARLAELAADSGD